MIDRTVVHTPQDAIKPVAEAFETQHEIPALDPLIPASSASGRRSFSIISAARKLGMTPKALMRKIRQGSVRVIHVTSRRDDIPIEEIVRLSKRTEK
jgi:hypothetical protein